jgi:hypothetical protein
LDTKVRQSIDAAKTSLSCLARRFQNTGSAMIHSFRHIDAFLSP